MQPVIKVKRLEHFCGQLPKYQSLHASGCDVSASISEPTVLKAGARALVPTGLSFEIPTGFEIQVRPRSGLAAKNGVTVANAPGTIDSDYRGELKVILVNLSDLDFTINPGDRIAQLIVAPVVQAMFEESTELSETARGAGGFGSTGLRMS